MKSSGVPVVWGEERATPGVQVTLEEETRTVQDGETTVIYIVKASGFPEGKSYVLFQRTGGVDGYVNTVNKFSIDQAGNLVGGEGRPLEDFRFGVRGYAKGVACEVALASEDRTVQGVTRFFPFPIDARGEGPCHVSVERVSRSGYEFLIRGEGFEPNEKVKVVWPWNGKEIQNELETEADGRFQFLTHHIILRSALTKLPRRLGLLLKSRIFTPITAKRRGLASFTFISRHCSLTVEYEWGPASLTSQ